METILSGDVGGTNTRLDLYQIDKKAALPLEYGVRTPGTLVLSKQYQNTHFSTFAEVLRGFLKEAGVRDDAPPISACVACAGPVTDNTVKMTNRDGWVITADDIKSTFRIREVSLINDFLAVGYGLMSLENKEMVVLQDAPKKEGAPIACIGAGTGLGECYLTLGPNGAYNCYPSEGGHAEFAPRSPLEVKMLTYLLNKFHAKCRVSVERVVSGTGLSNVYSFLVEEMPDKVDPTLHAEIMAAGDLMGKVIATNTSNELCHLTMQIFAGAYGSEAGVAALKWLPQGGLFITGGLTPKNIDLIKDPKGPFLAAFRDKGRVSGILDSVPVYAVLAEDVGQRGAYRVGYQQFYHMLPDLAEACDAGKIQEVCDGSGQTIACQRRNRLLLLMGVMTTCFFFGSKVNHYK
mmetsp:Transcript_37/g.78  ORF Transcript_37/g.78 Transcript_37/m.78 type:complete len:405 (+) Transcript_37:45-1259(+)